MCGVVCVCVCVCVCMCVCAWCVCVHAWYVCRVWCVGVLLHLYVYGHIGHVWS